MNRPTWLAAIVIARRTATAFAQMGGMGGVGDGMDGVGGPGMRAGMLMRGRMMPAGPTEVRRTAQVEMEGGHRLTGRIDLRPLMVQTDLGRYAILPEKIKAIRFLKPAKDHDAADEAPANADAMKGAMAGMMRAQNRRNIAMVGGDVANPFGATITRGKVITTSDQEIIGNVYIPMDFKLEFEYGSLTLAASKLRSITFIAPDRKAGAIKVDASSTRAAGEAPGESPAPPRYFRHEHSIIVASPVGERVSLYNLETGRSQSVVLSGSKDAPIEVTPVLGPDLVALALEGPRITRIAVADLAGGAWHPQELREPVEGPVRPVVAAGLAVYNLGRYVYAYSAVAHHWDVADLPEDLRRGGRRARRRHGRGTRADLHLHPQDRPVGASRRPVDPRRRGGREEAVERVRVVVRGAPGPREGQSPLFRQHMDGSEPSFGLPCEQQASPEGVFVMATPLPDRLHLGQLKNQAKDLLKGHKAGDPEALRRIQANHPRLAGSPAHQSQASRFTLGGAQLVVAREYDFSSWPKLRAHLESLSSGADALVDQFQQAIRADDAARTRHLLEAHPMLRAEIDEPLGPFDSPAITSARSREMLDVLLAAGANLNAKSRWWAGGFGLLHGASPELAAHAIERGAIVDVHAAARLGLLDRLRALVEADPELVHARGDDGQTPLHFAATVEALLESGAKVSDVAAGTEPVRVA